jgi:hypothetical protein
LTSLTLAPKSCPLEAIFWDNREDSESLGQKAIRAPLLSVISLLNKAVERLAHANRLLGVTRLTR